MLSLSTMSQQHSTSDKVSEEKHKVKGPTSMLEESGVATAIDDDSELLLPGIRQRAEKTLLRKLDTRLLPTIVLVFILNYIDRTAISSARLYGIEHDLHITDIQYETVLAVLYASYVPAQIPSNMILNRISRPSYYIPACVCIWGMTSALTGVTKNYAGILAARIFIGLPESAFYPGAIYLLSRWYTRKACILDLKELALRSALLYCGLLISNAFGSLIAAGILANMEGKLGIRAWRWLFYIEGAITVLIGLLAIWTLPDYPHNTRWLSKAERRLAQVRLAEDTGEADEDSVHDTALTGLKQALQDPKVYVFAVMTCSLLLGSSFVNFFPTLTATLGFSTTVSLLLAAPPWIFATILCCANAWHADRSGERFFHVSGPWWSVMIGYIIALSTMSVGGRYFAMFLMTGGYAGWLLITPVTLLKGYIRFSGFALTLVWTANVVPRPPAKRTAAIAIVNGIGNLGTLIGSYVWKAEWGPNYHPSMIIGLASLAFSSVLAVAMRCMLVSQNKKLDKSGIEDLTDAERDRIEEAARLEGLTVEEAMERKKGFRFLY
ncbi:uncharacterized protein PHACADRAFT_211138 [Phanerochaete carnosa HHB-10118-sp]|uniref:Major facilitator superfamily (MFS) profile domain-containing protein n=1 Tax=Phanerochaete carnosa (strain HHB-10118-sp) TaxID=650164 RepID=K5WSQ8_PHACS|nr:uncharacterized protein PHACADRAFT_211138 [Phanerochaete carnosa HHB-10118-sp]EKM53442.1 hypothetical protein PHACADRAFT_211138 [Phanerochaete carnosa HHB-10118-sp]